MPDPPGALGRDRPDVEREGEEVVGHQRALVGQALGGALLDRPGPVEAALAGDDDPLGDVAQHRVGGAAERTPGARAAGAFALLPDQLAPQQQAEVVLEDADDVGRQAAVRLAAEVGDVDRDAPAGLELADALGEHVGEQLEVLEVRRRHALALELLLVLLAGEVGRRGHDEGDRAVGDARPCGGRRRGRTARRARPAASTVSSVDDELGRPEAVVERRRVVALPRPTPKFDVAVRRRSFIRRRL